MDSQQKLLHHNKPAFILGNGKSRLSVEAKTLLNIGYVYGCNAQYREFEPHYLIAVDVKMVNEIVGSGYHRKHTVWTNPNKGIKSKERLNFFNPHKGWSSGPTALWLAASNGHREIYILGFDFRGDNGKFNNVYADTYNYKKSSDTATYYGNWLSQTRKIINEFTSTKFFRITAEGGFVPEELHNIPNLSHITYDELDKKFGGLIYSDKNLQKTTI